MVNNVSDIFHYGGISTFFRKNFEIGVQLVVSSVRAAVFMKWSLTMQRMSCIPTLTERRTWFQGTILARGHDPA